MRNQSSTPVHASSPRTRGLAAAGAVASDHCLLLDDLMDSNPLFLTGNTDTVYAPVLFDLD